MTYLKPPLFVRKIFNPLAMMSGISDSATLITRGRRSGKEARIPVIPVDVDGMRYIVSTRGESQWVRNLRAAGGGELRRKGHTEAFTATEIPAAERAPIIDAYREKAGSFVGSYWKKLPDPADHPVFRIEPRV
jgi:deazaflavin-dependent oxidoreductase (nitroreductase family)